jgi:hypothetical protein
MVHRLSLAAEAELDQIWWYIAEQSGSVEAAKSVVASARSGFRSWPPSPIWDELATIYARACEDCLSATT